jgi:tRNA A37 threonylcarbamoyladenosine synthetase subunit TsaC/SUA5/YrdC
MTITTKGRQLLWARSGGRCAVCRLQLAPPQALVTRTSLAGYEFLLTHQSDDLEFEPGTDGYERFILLCAEHKDAVEANPRNYPAQRLYAIKTRHEDWVTRTFDSNSQHLIENWDRSPVPSPGNRLFASAPLPDEMQPIVYRDDEWRNHGNLMNALAIVRQWGGLIVSPSDGSYGVNVDPANQEQVTLLRRLVNKQGASLLPDPHDPIPVVFDNLDRIRRWARVSKQQSRILADVWPAPLTLLAESVRPRSRRASHILSGGLRFAVRQPSSVIERALANAGGTGLTSMAVRDESGSAVRNADDAVDLLLAAMAREGLAIPLIVIKNDHFQYSERSTVIQFTAGEIDIDLVREGCLPYTKIRGGLVRQRKP